jgi:hypothetical protein
MASLDDFRKLLTGEHGLVVFCTSRADGSVQASVVNAGVLAHPVTGEDVIGLVARSDAVKLGHLRARSHSTVVVRSGWQWCSAEGATVLIGPDDPFDGFDPAGVPRLLRDIFIAAGGTHDDWDAYDRVMAEERRTAVLIRPERVYTNPGT